MAPVLELIWPPQSQRRPVEERRRVGPKHEILTCHANNCMNWRTYEEWWRWFLDFTFAESLVLSALVQRSAEMPSNAILIESH